MGFLNGKRILVTGVLSNRSIAFGIAQACRREGAELAFTYVGERFKDRVGEFASELGSNIVLPCDVAEDKQIDDTFSALRTHWDGLDGLVHSIGFAPREAIAGDFLDGLSREGFRIAHDISVYSFPALAKAALPMLKGRQSSVLTLTYLGAEKVVPNYNTMGLAKASLEASVRYLANALGPLGIRANAISAGPIKTLATSRRSCCRTWPPASQARSPMWTLAFPQSCQAWRSPAARKGTIRVATPCRQSAIAPRPAH
jgi:enoyl-[acyl-carrier protein] reductase I